MIGGRFLPWLRPPGGSLRLRCECTAAGLATSVVMLEVAYISNLICLSHCDNVLSPNKRRGKSWRPQSAGSYLQVVHRKGLGAPGPAADFDEESLWAQDCMGPACWIPAAPTSESGRRCASPHEGLVAVWKRRAMRRLRIAIKNRVPFDGEFQRATSNLMTIRRCIAMGLRQAIECAWRKQKHPALVGRKRGVRKVHWPERRAASWRP